MISLKDLFRYHRAYLLEKQLETLKLFLERKLLTKEQYEFEVQTLTTRIKITKVQLVVALKASGEKAEFRVFLDGKFIYDFHGYQGQACQKDIEPFMKDLEEVYGVHVKAQQEIWSNPDKISTIKYQTFNTNKNKR